MKKWIIILAALVVVLGTGGAVLWTTRSAAPKHTATTVTTTATKRDETITVQLPNADAIEARIEDYNDPTSLWVVVNKDLPLTDQHYRPSDLTLLADLSRTDKSNDERSIRAVAVDGFKAMITAAKNAGYDLIIGSGFRSYELQTTYFNHYAATSGEAAANQYSAKPGYSEHQTGLAADITLRSRECYLDACFGETPAGKWLAAHVNDYGFIIRYPADKTAITKYEYEPWHIRYVGKPLAEALKQSGLTLDEAYPYLQKARSELIEQKKITVQ